jgi:hypothetical protein
MAKVDVDGLEEGRKEAVPNVSRRRGEGQVVVDAGETVRDTLQDRTVPRPNSA